MRDIKHTAGEIENVARETDNASMAMKEAPREATEAGKGHQRSKDCRYTR